MADQLQDFVTKVNTHQPVGDPAVVAAQLRDKPVDQGLLMQLASGVAEAGIVSESARTALMDQGAKKQLTWGQLFDPSYAGAQVQAGDKKIHLGDAIGKLMANAEYAPFVAMHAAGAIGAQLPQELQEQKGTPAPAAPEKDAGLQSHRQVFAEARKALGSPTDVAESAAPARGGGSAGRGIA